MPIYDNIAVVLLSMTVLCLFVVAKTNSRLQIEKQNDSGWLSNSEETSWLLEIMAIALQISQVSNPFAPYYLLLHFLLSAFFILCIIELGLCFNAFHHQLCSTIKWTYIETSCYNISHDSSRHLYMIQFIVLINNNILDVAII